MWKILSMVSFDRANTGFNLVTNCWKSMEFLYQILKTGYEIFENLCRASGASTFGWDEIAATRAVRWIPRTPLLRLHPVCSTIFRHTKPCFRMVTNHWSTIPRMKKMLLLSPNDEDDESHENPWALSFEMFAAEPPPTGEALLDQGGERGQIRPIVEATPITVEANRIAVEVVAKRRTKRKSQVHHRTAEAAAANPKRPNGIEKNPRIPRVTRRRRKRRPTKAIVA